MINCTARCAILLLFLVVASGVTGYDAGRHPPDYRFLTFIGRTLFPFSTRLLIGCANVFAALWWTLPFVLIASFVGLRLWPRG